jgi:DNA-directed RNA polymerase subunit L
MQLKLNSEEANTLGNLLRDELPNLERELARTGIGAHELKHELANRIRLSERLIADLLARATASAPQPSRR